MTRNEEEEKSNFAAERDTRRDRSLIVPHVPHTYLTFVNPAKYPEETVSQSKLLYHVYSIYTMHR